MLNQQTIELLQNSHTDDDVECGLTPADKCEVGEPVENDGAGWVTWTETLYPNLESIPWQARGSAQPAE